MSFFDFALTVISSAAVSVFLASALIWLSKSWISERLKHAIKAEYDEKLESHKAQLKAQFDTALETHKAQLKSQSDLELERLRSSLAIAATERSVKFSRLHERRMDVVANTYAKLRVFHTAVAEYTKAFEMTGERSRADRRSDAIAASGDFHPYFIQNQIFLPKAVAEQVRHVGSEITRVANQFTLTVDQHTQPDPAAWIKVLEKLENEVSQALAALEDALRSAIGDES